MLLGDLDSKAPFPFSELHQQHNMAVPVSGIFWFSFSYSGMRWRRAVHDMYSLSSDIVYASLVVCVL